MTRYFRSSHESECLFGRPGLCNSRRRYRSRNSLSLPSDFPKKRILNPGDDSDGTPGKICRISRITYYNYGYIENFLHTSNIFTEPWKNDEASRPTQKFPVLYGGTFPSWICIGRYWDISRAGIICKGNTNSHICPGTRARTFLLFLLGNHPNKKTHPGFLNS